MWKLVKQISGAVGVVGTIAAASLWFNSVSVDIKEVNQVVLDSVSAIKEMVDYINVEQGWMASDIQGIKDTLKEFETEHKAQGDDIRSLTWVMRNQEDFTPEQLRSIMDEMLKKNLSSDRLPDSLPYWKSHYMIIPPQASTDLR